MCWQILHCSSYFLRDFLPKESAWLGRFVSVISASHRIVHGLITCERCMSSVTTRPRSALAMQYRSVGYGYTSFFLSEYCRRNTQGNTILTEFKALTKNWRWRKTSAVCAVWVRMSAYGGASQAVQPCQKQSWYYSFNCHALSHNKLVHQPSQ